MTTQDAGPPGALMAAEIATIPDAVANQIARHADAYASLGRKWRNALPPFLATCARGTSDQAALFLKYLTEIGTGLPVLSLGPSLGSLFQVPLRLQSAVTVAISQSGASPDLVALMRRAHEGGSSTVALVNTVPSALSEACDLALPLGAGPERAVAATKSFVASLVAVSAIHAAHADDLRLTQALATLPDALAASLAAGPGDFLALRDACAVVCLGRGLGLAIAMEAALKLKETCLIAAEGISTAEFRHGPLALARPGLAALMILTDDATRPGNEALALDLRARGVVVLTLGTAPADIAIPATGHPATDMICAVTAFYAAVHRLSLACGLDPDAPPHLSKATLTL